jgi:hypothetical protein
MEVLNFLYLYCMIIYNIIQKHAFGRFWGLTLGVIIFY